MQQFDTGDTVRYYYTPIGFLSWTSESGEALAKVDGIAWDSTLFTAPRGTWDTGDSRLRVPWRLLGGMIDPAAVEAVKEAWVSYQRSLIGVGLMPVWRLECKMVAGAKGTSRARVVGCEVMDGFWVSCGGPARAGTVFSEITVGGDPVQTVRVTGVVDPESGEVEGGEGGYSEGKTWDGDAV